MLYELKSIRKSQHLTQSQLAEIVNVPLSTYRNWEYLKNMPRLDELAKLAKTLGCTIDELIGDMDSTKFKPMTHNAPLYGKIAAGKPFEAQEQLSTVPIPDKFIDDGYEYFYLEVDGDSMNKVVHDGDYVLMRKTHEARNGDIVAVIINTYDATLKIWHKTDTSLILSPSSHNLAHQDIIFRDADDNNPEISVIGKMVWYMAPLM